MDVVAAVGANEESAAVVQPGEGAFDDPAGAAQSGAVPEVAVGDLGFDAALAELIAERVGVVAAVGGHAFGSAAGTTGPAAHGWHSLDQQDHPGELEPFEAVSFPELLRSPDA